MDQVTYKNGKKAAKRKLTKFFFLAIDQSNPPRFSYSFKWNQTTMIWNCIFPDLIIFPLHIIANEDDSMFIHYFYDS